MTGRRTRRARRGFALLVVLFAVSIATVVLIGLQSTALRQATYGRESLARVRAYWAARAGIESTIARLGWSVENPDEFSAYTIYNDLSEVAVGQLDVSSWEIVHERDEAELEGPADAHAKININTMSRNDLMQLPLMTEDVADAILDWVDEDESVQGLGAEAGYYAQLPSPYEPRNGPMRSLLELELVAGVQPLDVRGEDWNLNGRLDPNENDGDVSWPPDNADGYLDAGWSGLVTASSIDGGLSASGKQRIDLTATTEEELIGRFPWMTPSQAQVILASSQQASSVREFLAVSLRALAAQSSDLPQNVEDLTIDQLAELIDEATVAPDDGVPVPGRLNVNTVSRRMLDYLAVFVDPFGSGLADSIIFARDSNSLGYLNLLDLTGVPQIGGNLNLLWQLSDSLGVRSNAFVVTSRGRDDRTGIEVEVIATIQRTALPIVIREYRVQ